MSIKAPIYETMYFITASADHFNPSNTPDPIVNGVARLNHLSYLSVTMKFGAGLFLSLFCLLGCTGSSSDSIAPASLALVEQQRNAINNILMANHPHFTEGKSRAPSLNVDAFDFMLGSSLAEFPTIFTPTLEPIAATGNNSHTLDERIVTWIQQRTTETGDKRDFYVLQTAIGRTFGYPAQMDFLVLEVKDDIITAWNMFAITAY